VVPEYHRFYRRRVDNSLFYGPPDPQIMDAHDYTTIELGKFRLVGEGSYIRLADIRAGTGGVYSGPEIDGRMYPVPDGSVRLGVEPISNDFGVMMQIDYAREQVVILWRQLVRNRLAVVYPDRDIFSMCQSMCR
jgi:hypothetical protein